MEPLISVIVPVYNAEAYLEKCLDSIVNQSYRNMQIILINDGSLDGSGLICDRYAAEDARIEVIHQSNKGLGGARNAGLDQVKGQYISFVDSDDWIHGQMVEYLYRLILQGEADMSVCGYKACAGRNMEDEVVLDLQYKSYTNIEAIKAFYAEQDFYMTIVCNKLYKRALFTGIRFPSQYAEDLAVIFELLYIAKKIAASQAKLYFYYQRPDSISHKHFGEHNLVIIEYSKKRVSFFKNKEERELTELSMQQYAMDIALYYLKVAESAMQNKKEICATMKMEFDEVYGEAFQTAVLRRRMFFLLFKLNPAFLKFALKCRALVKK